MTAFTLPALAGNLLNQVYSITDSIIVGRYLGQTSLAAIGVCMPIIMLYKNYPELRLKKEERIAKGVRASWQLNIILCILVGGLLVFGGKAMVGIFLENPSEEITQVAYRYLLIAAVPSIFNGIMCIYQQVLRGVGRATESVIGGFMQLGAKVLVALIGARVFASLDIVWLAWPLSFIAGTIYPWIV